MIAASLRFVTAALAGLWLTIAAWPAFAQAASSGESGLWEATVGLTVSGAMTIGSASADLITSGGSKLTLFRTENSLGPGAGLEASLGRRLGGRALLQAAGGLLRTRIRAEVHDDFEGVSAETLSESVARLTAEGGVVFTVAERGSRSMFLRTTGGWMREVAGSTRSAADGFVGNVGAGMKYWRPNSAGRQGRRLGISAEGRAVLRGRGLSSPGNKIRVAPAASVNLVMAF